MTDRPSGEFDASTTPESFPLFPLGTVLFPNALLPLHIFEPRYRQLLVDRNGIDPVFGVVLTRTGREVADQPEIHSVGTAATMIANRSYPDGRADIAIRGSRRFRVESTDWTGPYLVAQVSWLDPAALIGTDLDRRAERVRAGLIDLVRDAAHTTGLGVPEIDLPEDPGDLSFAVAGTLWLNTWERQELLEVPGTAERLDALDGIIQRESRLLRAAGATGAPVERPGARFHPN